MGAAVGIAVVGAETKAGPGAAAVSAEAGTAAVGTEACVAAVDAEAGAAAVGTEARVAAMGVEAAWLWGRRLPRFLHRDQVHVGADVVLALLDGFLFAAAPTGFASTLRSSTLGHRVPDLGGSRRGRWPAGEKNGGGARW
uniref:Uncharacterized protein n=1 Tax=Oryza glaberrima TaxID=4538 RepID=I1PAA3_ORYGL